MLFGVFYASRKKSFAIKRTEGGRIPVCQLVSHYIVVQEYRCGRFVYCADLCRISPVEPLSQVFIYRPALRAPVQ